MWQSQAFAGALSFGASLPSEFGTVCCACAGVPAATAALAPVRNVRRPMDMLICRLPRGCFLEPQPLGPDCTAKAGAADAAKGVLRLTAIAWLRTVSGRNHISGGEDARRLFHRGRLRRLRRT